MQTFRVVVHGRGMVVRRWLVFRRAVGFYATRFVEADSEAAAGARALSELRGEPRLVAAAIRAPTLTVEEVEAVAPQAPRRRRRASSSIRRSRRTAPATELPNVALQLTERRASW